MSASGVLVLTLSQEAPGGPTSEKRPLPQALFSFAPRAKDCLNGNCRKLHYVKVICAVSWRGTKVVCWELRTSSSVVFIQFVSAAPSLPVENGLGIRRRKGVWTIWAVFGAIVNIRAFSVFICLALLWLKLYF